MFLCFYHASVYLAAVELKCSVLCSSSFWLGIHLFLAPHLECIALALLLFLSCINNFSLYLIIIAMCNFSHLKKKKALFIVPIPFLLLPFTLKFLERTVYVHFIFSASSVLIYFSQGFTFTASEKQLWSRSPMTSMLLNPVVNSQCSSNLACQQHLTQLIIPFSYMNFLHLTFGTSQSVVCLLPADCCFSVSSSWFLLSSWLLNIWELRGLVLRLLWLYSLPGVEISSGLRALAIYLLMSPLLLSLKKNSSQAPFLGLYRFVYPTAHPPSPPEWIISISHSSV